MKTPRLYSTSFPAHPPHLQHCRRHRTISKDLGYSNFIAGAGCDLYFDAAGALVHTLVFTFLVPQTTYFTEIGVVERRKEMAASFQRFLHKYPEAKEAWAGIRGAAGGEGGGGNVDGAGVPTGVGEGGGGAGGSVDPFAARRDAFAPLFSFFGKHRLVMDSFTTKMRKESYFNYLAGLMDADVYVAGDGTTGANRKGFIRGHQRPPHSEWLAFLAKFERGKAGSGVRPTVILFTECRTSKLDYMFHRLTCRMAYKNGAGHVARANGILHCTGPDGSSYTISRDRNAALNILINFLHFVFEGEVPIVFDRNLFHADGLQGSFGYNYPRPTAAGRKLAAERELAGGPKLSLYERRKLRTSYLK